MNRSNVLIGTVPMILDVTKLANTGADLETYSYTYDHAGRLLTTTHQLNGKAARTLLSNSYDEAGRLTGTTQGGAVSTTRGYNLHGWLTSIESTPFREYLYYEQPHNGSTAQYGGNISSMDWKTGDNILRGYTFQYDGLSRLTGAAYSENGSASTHYGTSYQYDLMGNITGLTRNGLQDDNSYGLIDNLSFDYNGNQLLKVTDAVTSGPNYSGAFHFNDHSNASIEYTYDANGNMTKDRNKYIMSVTYNTLNLPVNILYDDNIYTYSTSFHYAGDGRSLRVNHSLKKIKPLFPFKGFSGLDDIQKVVFPGIIKPNPAEMYNGDEFCGSLTYHSGTISYMSVDGGYVTFNSGTPTYHFYIHDHLGNNRVVVNESGTVEQVNHYYPYGGLMGESTGGDIQKYKYNGKCLERNHGLDWYDYGARHYDAAIVSWPTMDPLAEKYYSISPYVYCGGNPLKYVDPTGCDWISAKYGNELFVFFDSIITSQEDIINTYYNGEILDMYDISYVGSSGSVFENTEKGKTTRYILNTDGSFSDALGNMITSEVSIEGKLHIGNRSMITNSKNVGNWYGLYLGPDNPEGNGGDSYVMPPIDKLDYAAFLHDKGYDKCNAVGPLDAIFNPFVYNEDWSLSMKCSNDILVSGIGTKRFMWGMATGTLFGGLAIIKLFNEYRLIHEIIH